MSRIGKRPVPVPKGVDAKIDGQTVTAKGPKGEMAFVVNELCLVEMGENGVTVTPKDKSKPARSMWGMSRTQISNLFEGVSNGFTKKLELVGVGYRAQMKGKTLVLALGYSHDVEFDPPEGIDIKVGKPTEIEITGRDKQVVGEVAAKIRGFRPPEPYKGKGVRYEGEYIFRKEGKKK
ncbi:50S ribosomal protein L6 [Parvularcula bermudensis HTCC2503]|uniref:Large ribosomal subunit protein uL6 n=1 Tax=Parvularcula bermudensis (strain ATCC BAA-594 / HTCC2503 / KCTC 12087) TaxID=314260 RepID=E0TDD3_PARBH|nr:50S ribosomal protein L6 [Parvularcula bermudensis]ADM09956.1 50S ribosomal protein L6 [Parvularcula bermudensis HTCC2503]